jgi:hypothetical protein
MSVLRAKAWPKELISGVSDVGRCVRFGFLPRQLVRGQLAKFFIDEWQHRLGGPRLALFDRRQNSGHVFHRHVNGWPLGYRRQSDDGRHGARRTNPGRNRKANASLSP